ASTTAAATTAARIRGHALLLGPVAIVVERFQNALLDVDASRHGRSIAAEGWTGRIRVERIGDDRHALVEDLHADLRAAAGFREKAAAFIRAARVERTGDELHDVADGGGLEYDGVASRLDRDRVRRTPGLVGRSASERGSVDLAEVVRRRARPTAPGS